MICCVWSEILTFAFETTMVGVTRLLGRSNMIWAKTETGSALICAKRITWPLDGLYPSKERYTRWCGHSQTARHTPRWIMSSLRASERNSFLDVKAQRSLLRQSENRKRGSLNSEEKRMDTATDELGERAEINSTWSDRVEDHFKKKYKERWRHILRHFGIPSKIMNIVRMLYYHY